MPKIQNIGLTIPGKWFFAADFVDFTMKSAGFHVKSGRFRGFQQDELLGYHQV